MYSCSGADPVTEPANQYREVAEKCWRYAEQAVSSHDKESWLLLAAGWLKLAEDAEYRDCKFSDE
jgi:hypothetical protein